MNNFLVLIFHIGRENLASSRREMKEAYSSSLLKLPEQMRASTRTANLKIITHSARRLVCLFGAYYYGNAKSVARRTGGGRPFPNQ